MKREAFIAAHDSYLARLRHITRDEWVLCKSRVEQIKMPK